MSTIDDLGFKSSLVLMKIGHDLKETLDDTIEAPIPEAMEAKVAEIPECHRNGNEVIVEPEDYREIDDDMVC